MEQINDPYNARRVSHMVGWVEAENDSEKLAFVMQLLESESKLRYEAQKAHITAKGTISNLKCDLNYANQFVDAVKDLHQLMRNFDE